MRKALIAFMAISSQSLFASEAQLSPDPKLVQEILPNGVTVAVFPNSEPPQRVSMRLLVRRGSSCETESERGLAHFIEHMAFNGTKNFPAGDMVEYFQRLGMAFGADTNAHTSFDETVYKIDMPEVSEKLLRDGITLLRDYSDGMIFEKSAIESERGVIIAEKNSRDSQGYRRSIAEFSHVFAGTSYAQRLPIGVESVILGASRDDFLKFYAANYRPENTVVVIVGDVDAESVMKMAREIFADFSPNPAEPNRERAEISLEKNTSRFDFSKDCLETKILYHSATNLPNSYASLNLAKVLDGKIARDGIEHRNFYYKMRVISDALNARMIKIATSPESKTSSGSAYFYFLSEGIVNFGISADSTVGGCSEALKECYRQLFSFKNLSDLEIEKAKKKLFTEIEDEIESAPTRKNQQLANMITSCYSDGEIFTSPESDLQTARSALQGFDAASALEMFKEFFSESHLKVFFSDLENLEASAAEKLNDSAKGEAFANIYAGEMFAAKDLEFSKFGKEGKIAFKKNIEDLQILQVEFENGVRLNLKKTDFAQDEIITRISFGNGVMNLPVGRPEFYFAISALELGGTKYQNISEIQSAKFGRKLGLQSSVSGNSFCISNTTTKRDFPDMLRYACTLIKEPAFRPEAISMLRKQMERAYLSLKTNPSAEVSFVPYRLLKSDISKIPGTFEDFQKIEMEEISEWLLPILKSSYMEISVAGDIDIDETLKIFAQTFGSLPARAERKYDAICDIALCDAASKIALTYVSDGEPRSVALKIWLSCDKLDLKKMRTATLLGEVLDDVLRKQIREKEGKVYSPFAYNSSSDWIRDFGLLTALTFVSPEFNGEILQKLEQAGESLLNGVGEDEFLRAKEPILKQVEASMRKNIYWCSVVMDLSQMRPVNVELARTILSGYKEVSLEDLNLYAKEIFAKSPYTVSIMPDKIGVQISEEKAPSNALQPSDSSKDSELEDEAKNEELQEEAS